MSEPMCDMFVRNVLCGMVELSIIDAQNDKEYASKSTRREQTDNRASALHFIRSRSFGNICEILGLPADKLKKAALK
jgi:hypothetical protein